jgi:hypothetical protein
MFCKNPSQSDLTGRRFVSIPDSLESISELNILVKILFRETRQTKAEIIGLERITGTKPIRYNRTMIISWGEP